MKANVKKLTEKD